MKLLVKETSPAKLSPPAPPARRERRTTQRPRFVPAVLRALPAASPFFPRLLPPAPGPGVGGEAKHAGVQPPLTPVSAKIAVFPLRTNFNVSMGHPNKALPAQSCGKRETG